MHKRYIAVENIVRKGEIACNKQFLLISQCFLPYRVLILHFEGILKCFLQFVSIWNSLKFCDLLIGLILFKPFPNKPWFLRVCSTSLLKSLLEKEKLLVTSNFTLFHSVYYSFGKLCAIFIKFEFVVCKLLSLEDSKICHLGKG